MGAAKENVSNGRGQILDTLWFGSIVLLMQVGWEEEVGFSLLLCVLICLHPFPHFSFHPFFVVSVGEREGFCVGGTWAGWEQKEPVQKSLAELGQADKSA